MNVQVWIADFLRYLDAQRGRSKRTLGNYQEALNQFADFLAVHYPGVYWTEVESEHIRRWVADRMRAGIAPSTMNTMLTGVRSFYRFLLREGRVAVDPARLVRGPKAPRRLPTFVKEREMDHLFADYPFADDFCGVRNRTLMLTLYHTGIRAAEILGLNIADVDLERGQLRVTGKGNKQRVVPFGRELSEGLRVYLAVRAEAFPEGGAGEANALLLSPRGKRMRYGALRRVVQEVLGAVTTQKKRSPHVLRHSFATAMLAHGAQLEAIRQLLGHETVATTAIYTHTTVAELQAQYAAAHPHGKKE